MQDAWIHATPLVAVGTGLALAPVPEVAFALQLAGVGALIAAALVQRLKARGARVESATIVARWTLAGGLLVALIVLLDLIARE